MGRPTLESAVGDGSPAVMFTTSYDDQARTKTITGAGSTIVTRYDANGNRIGGQNILADGRVVDESRTVMATQRVCS